MSRGGVFDHLEWTYDGAFEQLFGLGSGEFEQKFSKNSNAQGVAGGGGMFKLRSLRGNVDDFTKSIFEIFDIANWDKS